MYKLSKFEYEYLKRYQEHALGSSRLCKLTGTIILQDMGYLKGIDSNTNVKDILANCKVKRWWII